VLEGKQVAEKTAGGGGKILLLLLAQFEQLWQNELKLNKVTSKLIEIALVNSCMRQRSNW
jgi:hypothetical protein